MILSSGNAILKEQLDVLGNELCYVHIYPEKTAFNWASSCIIYLDV